MQKPPVIHTFPNIRTVILILPRTKIARFLDLGYSHFHVFYAINSGAILTTLRVGIAGLEQRKKESSLFPALQRLYVENIGIQHRRKPSLIVRMVTQETDVRRLVNSNKIQLYKSVAVKLTLLIAIYGDSQRLFAWLEGADLNLVRCQVSGYSQNLNGRVNDQHRNFGRLNCREINLSKTQLRVGSSIVEMLQRYNTQMLIEGMKAG